MIKELFKNKKVSFKGGPLDGQVKTAPKTKKVYYYPETTVRAVLYHTYFIKGNVADYSGVLVDRRKHE
jgi:hypothetical protein